MAEAAVFGDFLYIVQYDFAVSVNLRVLVVDECQSIASSAQAALIRVRTDDVSVPPNSVSHHPVPMLPQNTQMVFDLLRGETTVQVA
eukprot:m.577756 g.577756  ORF g.577756 m.577756 type:complete len:87 (+) comp22300_c0_seq1:1913-2173(+)